jgi:hypothetical protein
MPDVKQIYSQGARGYQAAYIEAEAKFRQAQLDDDLATATEAAMAMNNLRVAMAGWDGLYADAQRPQRAAPQQAAGRPVRFKDEYGNDRVAHMTDDQREIAHGLASTGRISKEQAEQIYAREATKLARQRADGSYRDDQGRVTR